MYHTADRMKKDANHSIDAFCLDGILKRMAYEYDNTFKENLEKIVLQLMGKTTGIEPVSGGILYPELQYTVEREADFLEKVVTKDHQTIVSYPISDIE